MRHFWHCHLSNMFHFHCGSGWHSVGIWLAVACGGAGRNRLGFLFLSGLSPSHLGGRELSLPATSNQSLSHLSIQFKFKNFLKRHFSFCKYLCFILFLHFCILHFCGWKAEAVASLEKERKIQSSRLVRKGQEDETVEGGPSHLSLLSNMACGQGCEPDHLSLSPNQPSQEEISAQKERGKASAPASLLSINNAFLREKGRESSETTLAQLPFFRIYFHIFQEIFFFHCMPYYYYSLCLPDRHCAKK